MSKKDFMKSEVSEVEALPIHMQSHWQMKFWQCYTSEELKMRKVTRMMTW